MGERGNRKRKKQENADTKREIFKKDAYTERERDQKTESQNTRKWLEERNKNSERNELTERKKEANRKKERKEGREGDKASHHSGLVWLTSLC